MINKSILSIPMVLIFVLNFIFGDMVFADMNFLRPVLSYNSRIDAVERSSIALRTLKILVIKHHFIDNPISRKAMEKYIETERGRVFLYELVIRPLRLLGLLERIGKTHSYVLHASLMDRLNSITDSIDQMIILINELNRGQPIDDLIKTDETIALFSLLIHLILNKHYEDNPTDISNMSESVNDQSKSFGLSIEGKTNVYQHLVDPLMKLGLVVKKGNKQSAIYFLPKDIERRLINFRNTIDHIKHIVLPQKSVKMPSKYD